MKKERRLSSDSIATEISDELSIDGGFAIEAGAAESSSIKTKTTNNGDKRKRVLFAFIGLVVVALVVGLSVGLTKRDSFPKPQQVTSGTQSSADMKDITQDKKPKSSSAGTQTASPTPKPPTNAIFLTDGGFECTEHASCRCYDEEVCEGRKGVFTTHALEYDECEKRCLADEDCNGYVIPGFVIGGISNGMHWPG